MAKKDFFSSSLKIIISLERMSIMIAVKFITIRNNRWKAQLRRKKKNEFRPLHHLITNFAIFSGMCLTRMFYDCTGDFIAQKFCKALQSTKMKWVSFRIWDTVKNKSFSPYLIFFFCMHPIHFIFFSSVSQVCFPK